MFGVAVPPTRPFQLLDAGIRGLGPGIGHAGDQEDFDLGPPGVDGFPQPPGLGMAETCT